jgi:hypothetical protein
VGRLVLRVDHYAVDGDALALEVLHRLAGSVKGLDNVGDLGPLDTRRACRGGAGGWRRCRPGFSGLRVAQPGLDHARRCVALRHLSWCEGYLLRGCRCCAGHAGSHQSHGREQCCTCGYQNHAEGPCLHVCLLRRVLQVGDPPTSTTETCSGWAISSADLDSGHGRPHP